MTRDAGRKIRSVCFPQRIAVHCVNPFISPLALEHTAGLSLKIYMPMPGCRVPGGKKKSLLTLEVRQHKFRAQREKQSKLWKSFCFAPLRVGKKSRPSRAYVQPVLWVFCLSEPTCEPNMHWVATERLPERPRDTERSQSPTAWRCTAGCCKRDPDWLFSESTVRDKKSWA